MAHLKFVPSYHMHLHCLLSISYVFLYGYDGTGYVDDDGSSTEDENDGSDDQDEDEVEEEEDSGDDGVGLDEYGSDEVTDSGSSENDSVLAGCDARGGLSDDEEYNTARAGRIRRESTGNELSSRSRSHGRRATKAETPPKAGGKSRRKTMFEEMRRESLAGSLQPVGRNGQRQRRLSCDGEESLKKMALLSEEEEDGVEMERERRKTMGRLHSSNPQGVEETSDGPSEVSADSDEYDEEEDDEEEEKGGADPRFLIYFWAGARAKKSDWVLWKLELAKTMIPEWQKAG